MNKIEQLATKLAKDIRTLKELQVSDIYTPDYHLAMGLISLGYSNVQDKVHSRREWYQIGYKDAAKEILSPLLSTLSINIDTLNELQKTILMFAKQYGVEIRE